MNLDRRLFVYLKRMRWQFALAIFFAALTAVAIILQALGLSRIVDGSFLNHQNLQTLLPLILTFALITLGRFVFNWLSEIYASMTATQIKYALRNDLMQHINHLSPVRIDLEQSGEISNTVNNGVEALDAYFRSYLPQVFKAAIIPLTILIFVFPLDTISGIVFLFTAPVIPVFMILIGQLAKDATQKQWKTLSSMSAFLLDVIEGLTTLKILNRSKALVKRIETISEAFRMRTMRVLRIAFLSALVLEMAATISTAIIAVEIGLRLLYAKMAFADAFFILILAPEFYQPMRLLGSSFHAGMEGFEAAQRMFDIFAIPGQQKSAKTVIPGRPAPVSIVFEDVHASYPNAKAEALRGVSFEILPGKKNVLVGKSGSGKSTVFNLLLKFLQPSAGTIRVNGQSLSDMTPEFWYQWISWAPQKPYLFHDTIAQNIRLSKPEATDKEVVEACRMARLHDFIEQLPEGYQTIVGEHGARLSGGQAQRVSLARAFLKDAPIILLDEPTSNLDPQLDAEVQEILAQLGSDKTQFIIAHRLNTVQQADYIIALADGQVTDSGTFDALRQPGHYFASLQQQTDGGWA